MIIGITGKIAAGKETLTNFFKEKGFGYHTLSEILREDMKKKNLEMSRASLQDYGDMLRNKEGPGVLMKIFLSKIDRNKDYIIDGIRNPGEVEELKKYSNVFLIGVDAPQKIRFDRVLKRGKETDPKTWEDFLEVDNRDFCDPSNPLGQQVGKCMEMADFVIVNDGDLESSIRKIEELWEKMKSRDFWTKNI
ncbi:AAA family ATPase [Candidatus Pacearchaeota archaeon]|nr:AAA family ATPase [Candidatus Pacearchaeota archaeon]MBD3282992.1 AAA family ATPase [Candidatus Pacearchaeota archaeon]